MLQVRALRFDVSGRYAVAIGADGTRQGFVITAQPDGASCGMTDREPDDADLSAEDCILQMTRTRLQLAREIAKDPSLGFKT